MTLEKLLPGQKYWPVLGNHAGAPVNHFGGPFHDHWLNGPVAKQWGSFIGYDSPRTIAWGGYYTAPMEHGVHIIALQSNYYDSMNLFLQWSVSHWDIAGQLAWLDDV